MYVENSDGRYDEYIAAYKELAIDVAQLMAVENGGDVPDIGEMEAMWSNMFKIESKIAEVCSNYSLKIIRKSHLFELKNHFTRKSQLLINIFLDVFSCGGSAKCHCNVQPL